MRAFLAMAVAIVLAIGIGVLAATAVSPPAASQTNTWTITTRQPVLRLLVNHACPKSIEHDHDVTNVNSNVRTLLVPQGPSAALICRYGAIPTQSDSVSFGLVRSKRVGRGDAIELATAIDRISTKRPTEIEFCPAQFPAATIIAFSYTQWHDADLWYNDTGCATIDNGFLMASAIDNEPFATFALLVDQLAPRG